MVVAFLLNYRITEITEINYLVVSLFCDVVLPLSYLCGQANDIYICGIKFFWLRYPSCF